MENKEKKNVEEIFEGYIEKIFGKDCLKDIEPLYNKVLENRDNNVKCGTFGDDQATIPISNYLKAMPKTKKDYEKLFENYLENDGKDRSWLTEEYKKRFPYSYESEPESHINDYMDDGWKYFEYLNQNNQNYDSDIEWFYVEENEVGHIYYNELDHYLTYLLGAIRRGKKNDRIQQGKNIKIDLDQID